MTGPATEVAHLRTAVEALAEGVKRHEEQLRKITKPRPRRCTAPPEIRIHLPRLAGQSYDNALAETVNGYYKAELIYGPARTGPWKAVEDVELVTLGWVHWHNTNCLHGYLSDIPPAEFAAGNCVPMNGAR